MMTISKKTIPYFRTWLVLLFSVTMLTVSEAQERIVPLKTNPILMERYGTDAQQKDGAANEVYIYQSDTLELPFIDDFSADFFPRFNATPDTPGVEDTTLYYLFFEGEPIHPDTAKFIDLPNYRIVFTEDGETILSDSIQQDSIDIQVSNMDLENFELTDIHVWNGFNIMDSSAINGVIDTVYFLAFQYEQDSTIYYIVPPDSTTLWADNHAYLNNHLSFCPPTRGFATLDGLNELGAPYNASTPTAHGIADYLTSKPINLEINPESGDPYVVGDSIYFSFFYHPQGIGNDPETEDSLVLEFYKPDLDEWVHVWSDSGKTAFEQDWEQVLIRIADPEYFRRGFKFRFYNYATLSGNFDHWHIDYVRLDEERHYQDVVVSDVAYTDSPISIIKEYTSMPWKHYQDNPSSMMLDQTLFTSHHNLSDVSEQFTTEFIVRYDGQEQYSQSSTQEPGFPDNSMQCWDINHYNAIFPDFVFDETVDNVYAEFDVTFKSSNIQVDINRNNDSITFQQVFKDYYAYDDGSAEGAYEVWAEDVPAKIAYEFDIKKQDTLVGLWIHFSPVPEPDEGYGDNPFQIMAWKNLNPENIMTQNLSFSNVNYYLGERNAFRKYMFEEPQIVEGTIYVGIRQGQAAPANIGWDKNINNQDKIYYKFELPGEGFVNTAFEGSLMMRPIFASEYVSVREHESFEVLMDVYPNPASEHINFRSNLNEPLQLYVFDLSGRMVRQKIIQPTDVVYVNDMTPGMYIFRLTTPDKQHIINKKVMIQR